MNWWCMHGYAVYIWPAYGLFSGVLVYNVLQVRRRSQQVHQLLQQRLVLL